jgi:hypothetical protein
MSVKPAKSVQSAAAAAAACSIVAPQKPKSAHDQFAYATRAVW